MGLESSFNFIDDLDTTNPATGDNVSQGDDHLRGIKNAVKGSFTSLGSAAVTKTAAEINDLATLTGTETLTNKTLTSPTINTATINGGAITSGTVQATASGTTIDFTSIPSWAKKIIVSFNGVSTNAGSAFLVQIGDSGGIEATNYTSSYGWVNSSGSAGVTPHTTAFGVGLTASATGTLRGCLTLALLDTSTNDWAATGTSNYELSGSNVVVNNITGTKSLSGTLDRVRLTTSGSDTFDAGKINILYE